MPLPTRKLGWKQTRVIVHVVCCAAVRGAAVIAAVMSRIVTTTFRISEATFSVFGWRRTKSPFITFTLLPFVFFFYLYRVSGRFFLFTVFKRAKRSPRRVLRGGSWNNNNNNCRVSNRNNNNTTNRNNNNGFRVVHYCNLPSQVNRFN